MKTGKQKAYRLAVLLLSAVLLAAMFPAAAFADEEPEHDGQYYHFSSLDTLKRILEVESEEEVWATEVKDLEYTLREDLTIPTGKKVFFGSGLVTVEPGVTVTVEKDAALFFYAMDLYGTVVNRGDFVQCEPHEGEDYLLRIDGRLINSDWFCYVHAEGLENVENLEAGRAYTDHYQSHGPKPEPEPEPEPSPAPKPSENAKHTARNALRRLLRELEWRVRRFYMRNQETVRTVAPVLIVALLGALSAAGGIRKKNRNADAGTVRRRGSSPAQTASAFTGRSDLTDDQKKRIRHLDEWLQSGLIDRAEYKVLRERYERQQR